MASYHLSAQIVGRSPLRGGKSGAPRSVVAMAAYRAGARLRDIASGRVADFSGRRGVAHSEILTPEGSAPWLCDRGRLWNHVEAMERRRDAQLAREINLALPHELAPAARAELVRSFVREHFVSRGMVADLAIHEPVPEKGDDPRNHHAHVLLTLRQATAEGLRPVKTREWNSDSLLLLWRKAWTDAQNTALERAGLRARVDHRTLAAQREEARRAGDRLKTVLLDRQPEIHIGPRARQIEAAGRTVRSRGRVRPTARPSHGTFRSARDAARRTRSIEYPRIDQGTTRLRHAAQLAARERRRLQGLILRCELRQARLTDRAARLLKSARQLGPQLPGQAALRQAERLRAQQSAALGRELERILAGLLWPHQRASRRQRDLFRISRIFGRGAGRSRSDWPIQPGNGSDDSGWT